MEQQWTLAVLYVLWAGDSFKFSPAMVSSRTGVNSSLLHQGRHLEQVQGIQENFSCHGDSSVEH